MFKAVTIGEFPNFHILDIFWKYVSIFGGVQSRLVKFHRGQSVRKVEFNIFAT